MKAPARITALLLPFKVVLFFVAPALFAQGWRDLPNTTLQTVCPPTNFQPAGGGMPAYDFHALCGGKITDFSGAVVDTKRNRLFIDGGGHGGYQGNEKYALDMVTPSTSVATCGGLTCTISSNPTAPTMTRLNDPSVPVGGKFGNTSATPPCAMTDGSRPPEHTWGGIVYLPRHDKIFEWLGANSCLVPPDYNVYLTDPVTLTQTNLGPPSGIGANYYSNGGVECAVNPFTAHETVVCLVESGYLVSIDIDAGGAGTALAPYNSIAGTGSAGKIQYAASLVVDPDRRLLFAIGNGSQSDTTIDPHIWAFDMTAAPGSWTAVEWTASVRGCSDLMNYGFPSTVWDPSLHRIVGYVPRVASSASPKNEVIIFDPATKTCVMQPITGGPAAAGALLDNTNNAEQGMFGRFNYFPALGKYVLVNSPTGDAYTFTLSLTPSNGLGASTLTCVDRDGDGYGVGPGCLGPDADDQDVSVQTGAQFLAKWGTMQAGLQHLGYNPTNIWYLATTGSDAGAPPNCKNNAAAPCATFGYIASFVAPGDAVLLRGGTYTWYASPAPNGIAGAPMLYMGYPGELPIFATTPSGFNFPFNPSYIVLDGMRLIASGGNACVNIGIVNNMIIRHIDASQCEWGIDTELPQDLTIEDSILHDNGQHGIYLTNHPGPGSGAYPTGKAFVRRNISYNNPYTGFQMNGPFSGAVMEQNISYNNGDMSGGTGFSWLTGVSNSIMRDNVSINNPQGFVIAQYQAYCSTWPHSPCPYGQTGNLIENFTSYYTGKDRNGNPLAGSATVIQVGLIPSDPPTTPASQGHNTYRNIVGVGYHVAGWGYAPIYSDGIMPDFATSTFDNIVLYNASSPPDTVPFTVGSTYYTCAQAAAASSTFGAVTSCNYADPQFVSASPTFYNSPALFNLSLQSSSPALHSGTTVGTLLYDLVGNPVSTTPSMGAYEPASTSTSTTPSASACDINGDGIVDYLDVLAALNQALGLSACSTADLMHTGSCNVVDVQRITIAAAGGACRTGN